MSADHKSIKYCLSHEKPASSPLHLIRLMIKFSVGFFLLSTSESRSICKGKVTDLIDLSSLIIIVECGILAVFIFSKHFPNTCYRFTKYYIICFIFFDLLMDLFYLIWGARLYLKVSSEDECQGQRDLLSQGKKITIAYFLVFDFCIVFSYVSKACMILGKVSSIKKPKSLIEKAIELREITETLKEKHHKKIEKIQGKKKEN